LFSNTTTTTWPGVLGGDADDPAGGNPAAGGVADGGVADGVVPPLPQPAIRLSSTATPAARRRHDVPRFPGLIGAQSLMARR
jgi:hypothetical protein